MNYRIIFFIVFVFGIFCVQAQKDTVKKKDLYELSLDELLQLNVPISISSTKGDIIFKTPSTTSVIDKNEIEQYNFKSITEAIEVVSGITISRTYLKRNLPIIRGILQDHYANKVLILLNGIPIWNAVTGEGSLDRIDINDVERIEILRGPASVLYGTNAYSGAINIVLKEAEHSSNMLYSEVGTGNLIRIGGNAVIKKNDLNVFISAASKTENGYEYTFTDEYGEKGIINELTESSEFTINTNYRSHNFTLNTFKSNESYLGVLPAFRYGAGNPHKSSGLFANYHFKTKISDFASVKSGFTYDYSTRNLSRSYSDSIRSSIIGNRINIDLICQMHLHDAFNFEVGLNAEFRHCEEYKNYNKTTGDLYKTYWAEVDSILDGLNNMSDKNRQEYSVYGQLDVMFGALTTLIGTRFTNNDMYGNNVSSRASFLLNINQKNAFKLIYGESFRSPSVFETDFYYTTVMGNPELVPETSRTIELSYLTTFKRFFVQLIGYYSIYDKKIMRDEKEFIINDSLVVINTYVNTDEFDASGIELEIKYANPKIISAMFDFNFITGNNFKKVSSITPSNFNYVPKYNISVGLSKDIWRFGISGFLNYTSRCEGPFYNIPSWQTLDLNISYSSKIDRFEFKHILSVKNISNTDVYAPEYTRRSVINEVPLGLGRVFSYTLKMKI
ncbi:MAG: TonB-dependent receptor [Bacteroidales bacterium]|nr:TonB-dependent receptor [Bacteroidales bacterium]